jgi:ComF family protein
MKITSILGEIFFPRQCLSCGIGITAGAICPACFSGISINKDFFCGECGARLPIAMKICHPRVPCLIGAAGSYGNPALKALIHNLKFRGAREAAEPLAELLATFILPAVSGLGSYTIIPIPLARRRNLERGRNQSAEIAARLVKKLGAQLAPETGPPLGAPGVLVKTKDTKPQAETRDLQERLENLSGCFAVENPAAIAGKKILLIDDVTTSGSTFIEASKVLRAAGARKIIAIAAAKA